ncbi:phosphatidylinositol glycan anchor biosynthesis class U protein [Chelonus insularis]|uniref:phosphatidylinositol glycan anchor biosynthesis class U protein n=1 Tax=Chelonus insularis TaxID=460826 RepID=UPI00158D60AE|nr:phosphatidylinositol glycan anchor biosynthesis class U protein [Chelonus insularis]
MKMLTSKQFLYIGLASGIRFLLINSELQNTISERVEISTALNSWKRVTEGVQLRDFGIDPYSGDLFHETPLGLVVFSWMHKFLSFQSLKIIFIITDLLTAWFIYLTARNYIAEVAKKEKEDAKNFEENEISYTPIATTSQSSIFYAPAAYLFNPYIVLNCVGLTTTVFSNLITSMTLYFMIKKSKIAIGLLIPLLTLQNLYPASLLVPAIIFVVRDINDKYQRIKMIMLMIIIFIISLTALFYLSFNITGSWSFTKNTIGFILNVPDLRPNIGLHWYFFTEMFEHFRGLFIATFQINVGLLYIVPLALRLRKDPMLLSFAYLSIIAIFKSYPSIGDVGFYMALLPMWQHLFRHMQQGFNVGCFMLFCTIFAPTVWHQWIYARSANANFYFGVTLAFAIAQIFLLTDILFASCKREVALKNRLNQEVNGQKVKLILE